MNILGPIKFIFFAGALKTGKNDGLATLEQKVKSEASVAVCAIKIRGGEVAKQSTNKNPIIGFFKEEIWPNFLDPLSDEQKQLDWPIKLIAGACKAALLTKVSSELIKWHDATYCSKTPFSGALESDNDNYDHAE
jgi:hypothetical protein